MSPEVDATRADMVRCREVMAQNAKSFSLAAKLLPSDSRDEAACVYAFCRRVDDAIDDAPPALQAGAIANLKRELDEIYRGVPQRDPALRGFQAVVQARSLPRSYPEELLNGMVMDAERVRYETLDDLYTYCYRVAGVVGLMMCHAFGLTDDDALLPAVKLGLAMQLTNICRDVAEDYALGRVYLPRALLRAHGCPDLQPEPGATLPDDPRVIAALKRVTAELLEHAEQLYLAAEAGIPALPFRAGLAVRAARTIYAEIGSVVRAQGCDPRAPRAIVGKPQKLLLMSQAVARHVADSGPFLRAHLGSSARAPRRVLTLADVVGHVRQGAPYLARAAFSS